MANQDETRRERLAKEIQENQQPERYRKEGGFEKRASDDSDRITTDIQNALVDWKPSQDKKE